MQILYHFIVAYLSVHLVIYLFRERRFRWQASTAVVLVIFLLRLFLIK